MKWRQTVQGRRRPDLVVVSYLVIENQNGLDYTDIDIKDLIAGPFGLELALILARQGIIFESLVRRRPSLIISQ